MKNRFVAFSSLFASFVSLYAQESVSDAGRWSKEKIKEERPAVVTPPGFSTDTKSGAMPSDAIVFFDGKDLSKWKGRKEEGAKWVVKDGYMEVVRGTGAIQTRDQVEGDCQSLYKKSVALVNASRGPGKWQTYDVICIREKKDASGKVIQPGSITVLHNGIVTQFAVQEGGKAKSGGLSLQDHGNPVRFRNIWARKLVVPSVKAPKK
jgi:hypothetical protein